MTRNRRCVTCNKVDNQDIETNMGDFSTNHFTTDPIKKDQFICKQCDDWHRELMSDYEAKDDPYGWLDDNFDDVFIEPLNDNFKETTEDA